MLNIFVFMYNSRNVGSFNYHYTWIYHTHPYTITRILHPFLATHSQSKTIVFALNPIGSAAKIINRNYNLINSLFLPLWCTCLLTGLVEPIIMRYKAILFQCKCLNWFKAKYWLVSKNIISCCYWPNGGAARKAIFSVYRSLRQWSYLDMSTYCQYIPPTKYKHLIDNTKKILSDHIE